MIRTLFGEVPDFHARAACVGKALLMSSREDQDIAQAKAICSRCPVLSECREWAAELTQEQDPEMVMGGLTYAERRRGLPRQMRRCSTCNEVKSIEEFGRRKDGRDGRQSRCLVCTRAQSNAAYEKRVAKTKKAPPTGFRLCPGCDRVKPDDDFGRRRTCATCSIDAHHISQQRKRDAHKKNSETAS
ncbi:WhiB family transcriptional regulator [Nonomuraea sp. NPDC050556]|uniref:WhiB family transcriptional regulator n=1 Tax=Nonomuraea sp. NPDC050556 TaxID=3364369 RepID=UPI003799DAB7